jgi:hypothetical protein
MSCGTYYGYQRHRRDGEKACAPCRKAMADYTTAYRRRKGVVSRPEADARARAKALRDNPCGTPAAYARHRRDGETPCPECSDANARAGRAARGIKSAAPRAKVLPFMRPAALEMRDARAERIAKVYGK